MAKKFLTDINIAGGVYDSSGDIGNSGQVLSSTGSGVNWINTDSSASVVYQDGFTGDGSTTAFTLANSIDNENKTQVYIDGVYQHKDNYSLSGTTLTFSTAPPNSSDIEVISFSSVSSADDILYDDDFTSAGLMTTNGSGVYSITTNNSSNWNTAYTYSQVGHLPLSGGAITGAITTNSTFDGRDISVDGTKLDGIEANATADQTDAEIRAAVEAATDSNVFTDADHSKLNAIEASADVTDTANVTAAGALMDSEVTNLADVKAFDTTDYATAAQGVKADSAQQPPSEGAFVNGDKTKLDGIAAGAEVNVQSDWNSTSGDSLILNKPSIPSITGLASETYVDTAVSNLVDSAPGTLDTLNELAAALGDDANFSTTVTNSIATKLPLTGGTMTGDITISSTSPELKFVDTNSFTDTNDRWIVRGGADTLIMRWYDNSASSNTDALTLSSTAATFSGDARFNERVRIGDVTGLSNRGAVRIDTRGDAPADLLFGRDTAGTATGWSSVYWSLSSRDSTEGDKFTIYRGSGHASPYNSEAISLQIEPNLNATFGGTVTAPNFVLTGTDGFNLPSGGYLDWANGDARIVEGLVNNYSLSFQTYDGSAVTTALRLDGNNNATFAGTITASGRIETSSTGTGGAPSLEINNPSSSAFIHSAEMLGANMTAGQANILVIGKEGTTKQAGYIGYNWAASGSNNNYVTIGHWSANHLFRVYGDSVLSTVTLRGDVDMQAPIFYHKGNTSFYVSPGNGSNGISANLQGRIQVGTFSNSQTNSGEAWIGRASDRAAGVLTVQLGTGTGRKFEVVDYNWTTVEFSADDSGVATAAGSFRAPIFYDSNNTSYYINPADNSELSTATFTVNANSTISLVAAGTNASQIKAGAGDELYLGGNNTWQMRLSGGNILMDNGGYALSNGSMRAPIFYDSGDTAYYADINSLSHIRKIAGVRTNLATSEGWQETGAWNTGNQTGYFGGSFTINGSSDENNISWEDGPSGTRPTNKKELVWKVTTNSSDSGADGGWNKTIGGIDYNKSHISILYVKRVADGNGNFYHGTTTCLNLNGTTNGNPYFQSGSAQNLPLGVWCVSIGFLRANNDTASTAATSWSGIYRLDTGERIIGATDFRLAQSTTSQHRCFLYYSTQVATELWFANPGFYEINGNEPKLSEILMRPEDRTDSLRADVDMRAPLFYDSNDTTYYTNPADFSRMDGVSFGVPGVGASTLGRYLSIEGNADSSGEGSARIFFTEHNSTTAAMSNYGMSIGYRGGSTSIVGADGNTWTGLSAINNGQWGLWGHNNSAVGNLAMWGPRDGTYVQATGSSRAPIFYDSDNTGRYIDPASTSRIDKLEIANTAEQATPGSRMKIGSDGFIFGGNNDGYEINSAQISAGYHTSNSLNFVGMGTTSAVRRMDFWAEGGFYVSGTIYDKDSTSYYVDPASGTNLAGNVLITSGKLKVSTASLTYGTGYNFHNIENTNSNEPICVFYHSVGTTAVQFYGLNVISAAAHNNTTSRFFLGQGGGTERIKIYSNGNIQNSNNSYGQLSDINLKENIVDATSKLDEINQIRVVNFNYIGDIDEETNTPNKQIGVIAQEVEQIFPGLVYECGDTETTTKAVKYSVFVPMMLKAIQELKADNDSLKARIETLENN